MVFWFSIGFVIRFVLYFVMKLVMKFVVFRLVNTIKLFGFHFFIFGYVKPSAAKPNTAASREIDLCLVSSNLQKMTYSGRYWE
ncbi:hypothetical protein PAAL109150_05725 [Paenibacillus alkaliterrae]